ARRRCRPRRADHQRALAPWAVRGLHRRGATRRSQARSPVPASVRRDPRAHAHPDPSHRRGAGRRHGDEVDNPRLAALAGSLRRRHFLGGHSAPQAPEAPAVVPLLRWRRRTRPHRHSAPNTHCGGVTPPKADYPEQKGPHNAVGAPFLSAEWTFTRFVRSAPVFRPGARQCCVYRGVPPIPSPSNTRPHTGETHSSNTRATASYTPATTTVTPSSHA